MTLLRDHTLELYTSNVLFILDLRYKAKSRLVLTKLAA